MCMRGFFVVVVSVCDVGASDSRKRREGDFSSSTGHRHKNYWREKDLWNR